MLKATGRTGNGRPLLVLGLSGENMARLMNDEPIVIDCAELGLPSMELVMLGGRDEAAVVAKLRQAGFMPEGKPGRVPGD